MEYLTSRKNEIVRELRALGSDGALRRERRVFLCDGEKLLEEALSHGAELDTVLWAEEVRRAVPCRRQYLAPSSLLDYISPMKSAAGVLFTVRFSPEPGDVPPGRTLVLERIQDPGNLGTILRTANALGVETVIFTGACADVYSPKAVRASMGAVFRQRFRAMDAPALRNYLNRFGMRLYGAALSPAAEDLRRVSLQSAAVAVGSEGQGLSPALRSLCDGELIIPMKGDCESLNAAIAAAIIMWELTRETL